MSNFSKWVACWGNATSYTDQTACTYSKDITLRYPVRICFDGDAVRVRLSNITGSEPVCLIASVAKMIGDEADVSAIRQLEVNGNTDIVIDGGCEITTDPVNMDLHRGDMICISIYLPSYTCMNSGVLITGPLSRGSFCYGRHDADKSFPLDKSRKTNWFYFLNTIDIHTEEKNKAVICYGDSITAQAWPDFLIQRCFDEGFEDTAIIRRAVSGTRILRQYDSDRDEYIRCFFSDHTARYQRYNPSGGN